MDADYHGRIFEFVCLFVCLSVCPQLNSETNDPKVFKFGVGNDLGISYKWCGLGLKGQRSWLWLGLIAMWRKFELYERLLYILCTNVVIIVKNRTYTTEFTEFSETLITTDILRSI